MAKGTIGNVRIKGGHAKLMTKLGHSAAAVRQMRNKGSSHHSLARGKGGGDSTAQGQLGTGGGMAGPNIIGG